MTLRFFLFTGYVHEVRSKVMNHGAKGEPVLPGGGHVLHVYTWITVSYPPTPKLQRLRTAFLAHCAFFPLFLSFFYPRHSIRFRLMIPSALPRRENSFLQKENEARNKTVCLRRKPKISLIFYIIMLKRKGL